MRVVSITFLIGVFGETLPSKTDVTPAIFSRNFVAQLVFRDKVARVTERVAQPFSSRATRACKTDVLPAIFLRNFVVRVTKSQVRHGESCEF